ncbi:PEP/pyruvate-binding domain-containing protein, partial [Arthrospira platensis SPKY2]
EDLVKRLAELLETVVKPLAIRSSGILEDSISYPFSGVYPTYLIPNCHQDIHQRLRQLMDAIRLVYVSVFSPDAQGYFESIGFPFEEERMALVVQEVVGNRF